MDIILTLLTLAGELKNGITTCESEEADTWKSWMSFVWNSVQKNVTNHNAASPLKMQKSADFRNANYSHQKLTSGCWILSGCFNWLTKTLVPAGFACFAAIEKLT
ncbi:uncharacterized protein [Littorina saxatilis]|uniref:uncharacterized protein n=1 Tax=Littorina saxatilis TaxID=31220 RepID=UPI0038B5753A